MIKSNEPQNFSHLQYFIFKLLGQQFLNITHYYQYILMLTYIIYTRTSNLINSGTRVIYILKCNIEEPKFTCKQQHQELSIYKQLHCVNKPLGSHYICMIYCSGKAWRWKSLANLLILSIWRKKFGKCIDSAKRL